MLAKWIGCSICYFSWNLRFFSDIVISLLLGDIAASMGYNFNVGVPEAVAKRIIGQLALRTAVGSLRATISQQDYLIANY
jgi:hypothetical protein